jgi:hypothetical protein
VKYKVKWRIANSGPLTPELVENAEAAKRRARELILEHGENVQVEMWNEEETWQVVAAAGAEEWATTADERDD